MNAFCNYYLKIVFRVVMCVYVRMYIHVCSIPSRPIKILSLRMYVCMYVCMYEEIDPIPTHLIPWCIANVSQVSAHGERHPRAQCGPEGQRLEVQNSAFGRNGSGPSAPAHPGRGVPLLHQSDGLLST